MTEQHSSPPGPAANLRVLRIIWAALLMGEVLFLVVATTVAAAPPPRSASPAAPADDSDFPRLLFYIALGMLVTVAPIAFMLRQMTYQRGRQPDGTLAAGAYATGNILFWAMFEGVGMFAITGALLNGGRGPHLYVAAAAMAIHILTFPTGAPLRAGRPDR